MSEPGPALRELARLHGVLTSYEERPGGPIRQASAEALLGVVRALGATVAKLSDVPDALRARKAVLDPLIAPVVVVWGSVAEGRLARVPSRPASAGPALECTLTLEAGDTRAWRASIGAESPSQLAVPGPIPFGYHRLTVRQGTRGATSWLFCAPERTWQPDPDEGPNDHAVRRRDAVHGPRDLGLFLPLYALRTARSWGTADLTDLKALLDWSAAHGASFLGTLPLLATFLGGGRAPVDPGPYAPVSRLFWNELYLDAECAPGLERAPDAQTLLASRAFQDELAELREGRRVRYRDAMGAKRRVLEELARAVAPLSGSVAGPLADYAAGHSQTVAYARFRASMERRGPPWRSWPGARAGELPSAPEDEEAYRYHLYVQWALDRQVRALPHTSRGDGGSQPPLSPSTLYLDLPLGSHPEGFDGWRFPRDFTEELSAGAPPDLLQEAGQDWGFPPLHPERAREDGHVYLRRSLEHLMRAAGMVRLDHVMSLHRLYCIPTGHPPVDGAYVRYPAEELYAALTIESNRWRCEVVGEDLGTVPEEVRRAMAKRGLTRMYLLPFELHAPATLAPPPPLSVASLGTHDLPPFATYATGDDIDRRAEAGSIDATEAARQRQERAAWIRAVAALTDSKRDDSAHDLLPRALRLLAVSPARHLLVSAEDLWGETESQNQPGTVTDANWTLRARYPLEEWGTVPGLEKTLASLVEARRRAGARPAVPDETYPAESKRRGQR